MLENITELENYGLVKLVEEGRSKQPVVWYDKISVDMPFDESDPDIATV